MKFKVAQAWGFDLLVAAMIFLAGIVLFYFYAVNYSGSGENFVDELASEGDLISDGLLSEGAPSNWNSSNVISFGLLTDGRINSTKVKYFDEMVSSDYVSVRERFNVRNNFYVNFSESVDGVELVGVIGVEPENLFKLSRAASYSGKVIEMEVVVWN